MTSSARGDVDSDEEIENREGKSGDRRPRRTRLRPLRDACKHRSAALCPSSLDLAPRVRRRQHAVGSLHRILPGGDGVQSPLRQAWQRVQVTVGRDE